MPPHLEFQRKGQWVELRGTRHRPLDQRTAEARKTDRVMDKMYRKGMGHRVREVRDELGDKC